MLDRQTQICTAIYWLGMQEAKGDFLAPLLKRGDIRQATYDQAVDSYDMYLHLWILCVRVEVFVKEECQRKGISYPFSSPYELFIQSVQEQGDYEFSLCLTSYREFSAQKHVKGIGLLRKYLHGEGLTEDEEKLLTQITPVTGEEMTWTHFLLNTATKKAGVKNPHLKRALDYYHRACADVGKRLATQIRKGGSLALTKGGYLRSQKGKGGVYRKLSS